MAFTKPSVNKIVVDIKDITIYLRSIKKFGKSTLFRDTIIAKYGDAEKGLLLQCGKEKGTKMLDNVNTTRIKTYKDAIEFRDWLISTKGTEHDIQIICFDTVDELVPIFEEQTIKISNTENPNKKTKTINGAMGGYQAGQDYTAKMIKDYIETITDAGIGVWAIAHTKFKTIKEKGGLEEDGYQQLTSNLVSAYESAFGDIFDVTLTGVIDRNVEVRGEGDKAKRYATDEIRKLYFRGTSLIDAGGRFAMDAVPEYLVFDKPDMGAEFVNVIETGMEKSKTTLGSKKNKKEQTTVVEKIQDEVIEEPEDEVEDIVDDVTEVEQEIDLEALVEQAKEVYKNLPKGDERKAEITAIVKSEGQGKFGGLSVESLQKIISM